MLVFMTQCHSDCCPVGSDHRHSHHSQEIMVTTNIVPDMANSVPSRPCPCLCCIEQGLPARRQMSLDHPSSEAHDESLDHVA